LLVQARDLILVGNDGLRDRNAQRQHALRMLEPRRHIANGEDKRNDMRISGNGNGKIHAGRRRIVGSS